LDVQANNVWIDGLAIDSFNGPGVLLNNPVESSAAWGAVLDYDYISTDLTGQMPHIGNTNGVVVLGANSIIGLPPTSRLQGISKLNSGNGDQTGIQVGGIFAEPDPAPPSLVTGGYTGNGVLMIGSGASNNEIENNLIGTDITRLTKLGNTNQGVELAAGANNNFVGNVATPGSSVGNVISGNVGAGVDLDDASMNLVADNFVGLGVDGATKVGNGVDGVGVAAIPFVQTPLYAHGWNATARYFRPTAIMAANAVDRVRPRKPHAP
jgi:hypothetical protein